jgi:hypothetical protein
MKKYKLIRKYPGSPELGTVATFRKKHHDYIIHDEWFIPVFKIENYPEFWEEIIEYPIGTLVRDTFSNANFIYKKKANYKWICLGSSFVNPIDSIEYTIYDNEIGKNLRYVLVEKNYEILSFRGNNLKYIYKLQNDGFYWSGVRNDTKYLLEEELAETSIHIYSVKRLSDNSIFTIGDSVTYANGKPQKKLHHLN